MNVDKQQKKQIIAAGLWTVFLLFFGCRASPSLPLSPLPETVVLNADVRPKETTLTAMAQIDTRDEIYAMAWSPTEAMLAVGGQGKVELWDTSRQIRLKSLSVRAGDIVSLAFSSDGELLAAGGHEVIDLWHIASGRHLRTFSTEQAYVSALAFSPDGRYLASGSSKEHSSVSLWDLRRGTLVDDLRFETPYADRIVSLSFSPEAKHLAAVGLDHKVRVWSLKDGRALHQKAWIFSDPSVTPTNIAFGSNKTTLALGSAEGRILLFDLETGVLMRDFSAHPGRVEAMVFQQGMLISSGSDHSFIRFNPDLGGVMQTQRFDEGIGESVISSDGRFAAVPGRFGVQIFSLSEQGGIPPVIAILSPLANDVFAEARIHLRGKVVDDRGISEVSIRVNGVRRKLQAERASRNLTIQAKARSAGKPIREIVLDEQIVLQAGDNVITIKALDLDGLSRTETLRVRYRPEQGEVWAAVIGISQYQEVKGLKYADADAKAFYDYLVKDNQVPEDHVTLLLNEEATLQRLRDVLGVELKEKARRRDTVIIYYAGHGAPELDRSSLDGDGLEKYLLPYDADPKRLYSTALPMAEVEKIFSRISAERIIMLQDTCFSGGSAVGRTLQTAGIRATHSNRFLDRMTQGKGRVIITASEADEVSLERDDLGHGVFTYYLLESFEFGDEDGDGFITTNEAFRYVSDKVPKATGQNQHPVKKGIESSEIVIGRVRAP